MGKHAGKPDPKDAKDYAEAVGQLPTYQPFDASNCKHRSVAILSGRKVCNDGCGADLGAA